MPKDSTSNSPQGPEAGTNPLSVSERRYLEHGELGSYRTATELVERIEKKMDDLPARIDSLHRDVELISRGDPEAYGFIDNQSERPDPQFFTFKRWGDGWLELMGFEDAQPSQAELLHELRHQPPAGKPPQSAPADFGMKLGQLARRLMLCPDLPGDDVSPKQMCQEIVWGFIRGCYLADLPAFASRDRWYENGEELAEMIEQRTQEMGDLKADQRKAMQPTVEPLQKLPDVFEYIDTVLADNGLQGDWIEERTKNLVVEHYGLENLLTCEQPLSELLPEAELLDLVEDHRVAEHQSLREQLASDADCLRNRSYQRLKAEDVFETIFPTSPKTNRELRDELDLQARDTRPAKIAKDLAGRDWDSVPLLTETEAGWQLTDYGRALGNFTQELEKSKLNRDLLPKDLVDGALSEWANSEISGPPV